MDERDLELLRLSKETEAVMRRCLDRTDWNDRRVRAFVGEIPSSESSSSPPTVVGHAMVGRGYPPYFPALEEGVGQLYLAEIEILEPFQRCGYGTAMLQAFIGEARELGAQVFRAECAKGWRVDRFYTRAGFAPVPYRGPAESYPESHQMLELWL